MFVPLCPSDTRKLTHTSGGIEDATDIIEACEYAWNATVYGPFLWRRNCLATMSLADCAVLFLTPGASMLANILCPIEFTTLSHQALEHAVAMARTFGAAVTGIHVVTEAVASLTSGATRPATAEDVGRAHGRVLALLREANAPRPTAVAILGDPAAEIVHLAVALPADLIVMPSHGRTGSADGTRRSVTEQVLCHAPAPVILVPDAAGVPRQGSGDGFHRIVCGIDFSPASLKALRYARDLAAPSHARLVVTHVLRTGHTAAIDASDCGRWDREDATSIWRHRLHTAAHEDTPPAVTIEERLGTGDPATSILQLANEEPCDLIVIGGHRGNPPGCVMHAVLTGSRCPVFTVRVSH